MACLLSRATRDDSRVSVAQCTYDCPTMHSTPPTSIEPPDDKAVIELISPDRLNPYLVFGGDTRGSGRGMPRPLPRVSPPKTSGPIVRGCPSRLEHAE